MLVRDLGLIDYEGALRIQESTRDEVSLNSDHETLLVCEHPNVITVGRAPGSREEVLSAKLPIFEASRGGRATLHLPGQVVIYPILDLKKRGRDLHGYMRELEEAIIETLSDFRIKAERVEGKTGVWVGPRKIASLGIAVKKWVTYHGIALNVNCDLSVFSHLQPCGFQSNVMTSVDRELNDDYRRVWKITSDVLLKDVSKRLIENLLTEFNEEETKA